MSIRLLALCAIDRAEPLRRCVGQSRFLGEAGLEMARRGVDVICAEPGSTVGYRPVPGAWEEVGVEAIDAVYDRHHRSDRAVQQGWERGGTPVFNPVSFSRLCDDKLAFYRHARRVGLPVPETVTAEDPAWQRWDRAFAKPRFGSRGTGVRVVSAGDDPGDGIVQRAVQPDRAGSSIRLLVQRDRTAGWVLAGAMDRLDRSGADVTALSRGAEARELDGATRELVEPWLPRLTEVLEGLPDTERIAEVGVDVVVSRSRPFVLEFNARPGRSFDRAGRPDLRRRALLRPFERMVDVLGRVSRPLQG